MNGFIEKYTAKLVVNKIVESEDKDLYVYGMRQGLLIIVNIVTTIVIGFIFGMVWQSIVFMLAYIPLRSYVGGFHAKTPQMCYIYSIALTMAVLLVIKFVPWSSFIVLGIAMVAGAIIIILAPVEDSNKRLDKKETAIYRKWTRIVLVFELCIGVLLLLLDFENVSTCIVISLLASSLMLVIGKIKNRKMSLRE